MLQLEKEAEMIFKVLRKNGFLNAEEFFRFFLDYVYLLGDEQY